MTSYVIYYNDRRIGFKIPEDVYPSSVTQFAVRNVHGFSTQETTTTKPTQTVQQQTTGTNRQRVLGQRYRVYSVYIE